MIPRAVGRCTWGSLRHPLKYDGPLGVHIVMVVVLLLMAVIGAVRILVVPDRGVGLGWMPVFLISGMGLGILLVRETPGLDDGNQAGSTPPAKHRE